MVTGKKNLLELLRQNALVYWKLRTFGKNQLLCEAPDADSLTLSSSLDFLAEQIELLGPGQYNVEAWETLNQKKDRKQINFEIPIIATQQQIAAIGSINGEAQKSQIDEAVQQAITKYKQEIELADLRERIKTLEREKKELEADLNSSQTRIMNRVEPYLGTILESVMGAPKVNKAVALSGADKENSDKEQKRLEVAFDKWMAVEPEVITICEKIADMAVNDKNMYNMARGMLIK